MVTYDAHITIEVNDGIEISPSEISTVVTMAVVMSMRPAEGLSVFCGMCGDTGYQNGQRCPQPGCRKANGLFPFHINVTELEVTRVEHHNVGRPNRQR